MRLFSIIAALVLGFAIYLTVFERPRLQAIFAPDASQIAAKEDASADADETAGPDATGTQASAPDEVAVFALRSHARDVETNVTVRGQTQAFREVDLSAETAGAVISDPLRKGVFVETGDILCRLDPGTREAIRAEALARLAEAQARLPAAEAQVPESEARVEEARARVIEAKARLREAEINFTAAEKLSEGGFASQTRLAQTEALVEGAKAQIVSSEASLRAAETGLESVAATIEAARAGLESAQAVVAAAEKDLERLSIAAPFSGLLESDTAELGSFLQTGGLCATIIQLDPIMLVGFVPETAIGKIELGAEASARIASGDSVTGAVTFISRAADAETRTFRVEIEVANPDFSLRDGQSAEITISAEGVQAHLLPQSALTLSDDGALGVRIVTPERTAQFVPVSLLRDTPNGIFVAGLPATADVITIGQEFVADGVPVAPSFQEIGQ
ncbi:MAG: efflux RND transporter periplasmic adaptor subunit [Pseudomonadota bacterium]